MGNVISPLCPDCRGVLAEPVPPECPRCGRPISSEDGIPILIHSSPGALKEMERDYHDGVSGEFDRLHDMDAGRVAGFKTSYHDFIAGLPRGSAVLELGCGTGWDAMRIADMGMAVYIGDISPGMVRKARQRIRQAEGDERVRFFVFDAESIPFPSDSFDAVLIVAALHHLPTPSKCVSEMARVCRTGGIVVLGFEPNAWPYFTFFPAKRLLSLAGKGIAAFAKSPVGTLRLIPRLKFSRGSIVEKKGGTGELFSPGDRESRGFSLRRLRSILERAGLEPLSVSRVWYINGFIQEIKSLRALRAPHPVLESFLVRADMILAGIPVIRAANWHWNVVARKL